MNSAPFLSLLAVLCLGASSNLSFAQTYRSHPPMRPLPPSVKAPLAVGPKLFVDAVPGNDTGAGSPAAPWKSLAHATRQLQPGDTLYLRGGMYYEKVSLTRSGTTNALDLRVALGECIRHFGGEVVHIGRAVGGGGPGEQFRSELVGGCRGEHLLRGAEQRLQSPRGVSGETHLVADGIEQRAKLVGDGGGHQSEVARVARALELDGEAEVFLLGAVALGDVARDQDEVAGVGQPVSCCKQRGCRIKVVGL